MSNVAQEAKEAADKALTQLVEREKLHDERHNALQSSIEEIKSILVWVGGVLITLILGVLGWSLVQQYNANEAQKLALQAQISALEANSD